MSFALTTPQILARTKTVTRRLGWTFLQPGDLLQPVKKNQGLKKGERVERVGGPVRVVRVHRERLSRLVYESADWARREVVAEGFPAMDRFEFFSFFSKSHGAKSEAQALAMVVTRIEFEYVEPTS